ncbi:MAG: YabP/YqfC family sporulation protein, partial [Clostridia bacterium]|nr:YabP/YqfC family sporulation protein [Clostridia bacterium]
ITILMLKLAERSLRYMGSKLSKITAFLEMPEEIMTDKPRITILGFDELAIENYKNILEYDEIFIKVNTYIGAINISGIGLKLIQMNKDDIMVTRKNR